MHFLLPLLAWLLSCVLAEGPGGANYVAHSYERIWMWEMYDTITDIEGPDKQNSIFPQQPKQPKWKQNMGSGEGKKYTYAEFMTVLERGDLNRGAEKDLVAPGSAPDGGPTVHECSKDLLRKGWASKMPNLNLAHPELTSSAFNPGDGNKKPGRLYNPKDPWNGPYTELASRLDNKFQDLRAKFHDDSKWGAYITTKTDRMKTLVESITTVRREDTSSWLRSQVSKSIDPVENGKGKMITLHGLGLDGVNEHLVVSTRRPSAIADVNSYAKAWDDIDIRQTMQNAWGVDTLRDKLNKVGYKRAGDLRKWANYLGDPDGEWKSRYTELNMKHFRVLKTWRTALERIKMTPEQLKTCR
ncbi:hypothetical protein PG999_000366 [Apiospora kogelbergensis]|uniref:Uncharacterized protein n=1 Tax=Apiospora kogelbergensis TaxID=1337665 RepID=A0AAW0RBI8_9PEZI